MCVEKIIVEMRWVLEEEYRRFAASLESLDRHKYITSKKRKNPVKLSLNMAIGYYDTVKDVLYKLNKEEYIDNDEVRELIQKYIDLHRTALKNHLIKSVTMTGVASSKGLLLKVILEQNAIEKFDADGLDILPKNIGFVKRMKEV